MIIIIFFKQNKRIIDCHVMEYDCSFFVFLPVHNSGVYSSACAIYIYSDV